MKVKQLYLDMDGVLSNFEKRYFELFDETANEAEKNGNFSKNWKLFVEGNNFETLEWFPGAHVLLDYVQQLTVPISILSSSGRHSYGYHEDVKRQKKNWILNHGINYKPIIVPGAKLKAQYAGEGIVLIDDTEHVIDAFNNAGGIGILHSQIGNTIDVLNNLV